MAGGIAAPRIAQAADLVTIDVAEIISVSDSPQVLPPVVIEVSETISVTDSPQVLPEVAILVMETILVTDSPQVLPPVVIEVSETISVTDSPQVLPEVAILVMETILVTDSPDVITFNNLPVASNDSYSTNENTTLNVATSGVLGNDSDIDGDPLTAIKVTGPANGTVTLNSDGSLIYTPDANWNGIDSVTYKANDGLADSNLATVTVTVNPVNDLPVAVIDVADSTIPLPVTMKVTPQTLNLERLGKWVKAHLAIDEETIQETIVTLDGSGSFDSDGDPITYDWTLTGPKGEIGVDDIQNPSVTLTAGSYFVELIVNDGTVDSTIVTASFTLTNQTMDDLAVVDPSEYTLNGVPASEVKGDEDGLVISFNDDDIAATVDVGLDVEMVLLGSASGVDYIDVIQDKENGNGNGKSKGPK